MKAVVVALVVALAIVSVVRAADADTDTDSEADTQTEMGLSQKVVNSMSVWGATACPPSATGFDYKKAFADYCKAFGKVYVNGASLAKRFELWKRSFDCVEYHNKAANQNGYTMRLNHLADHTNDEVQAKMGFKKDTSVQPGAHPAAPVGASGSASAPRFRQQQQKGGQNQGVLDASVEHVKALPASLDWRQSGAVTQVGGQGSCGDCWAWTAKAVAETAWKIAGNTRIPLSAQHITDCASDGGLNNWCQGGSAGKALRVMRDQSVYKNARGGGICSERAVPFKMTKKTCVQDCIPTTTLTDVTTVWNEPEEKLMEYLQNGAVAVAIYASDAVFENYGGGVFDGVCNPDFKDVNHAVTVIGYGTDPKGGDYWLIKNSWTTTWGEGGYMRMKRGKDKCGIRTEWMYATAEKAANYGITEEDQTKPPQFQGCLAKGGSCQSKLTYRCSGTWQSGLCGPGSSVCCVPKNAVPGGPVPSNVTPPTAPAPVVRGPNPRPTSPYGKCTVDDGRSGECLDISACRDTVPPGKSVPKKCPGPPSIMCCVW